VNLDLGSLDGEADSVIVNGTEATDFGQVGAFDNGSRIGVTVNSSPSVNILAAEAANDTLTVNALGGNDSLSALNLTANLIGLIINGGEGNDAIIGSQGNDTLIGGAGNDTYRFDTDLALGSDTINESGGG